MIKSHDFLLDPKNVEYTFKCGITSFIIIIKFLILRKYTNIDVDKNVFFCLFVKYLLINHQSLINIHMENNTKNYLCYFNSCIIHFLNTLF